MKIFGKSNRFYIPRNNIQKIITNRNLAITYKNFIIADFDRIILISKI